MRIHNFVFFLFRITIGLLLILSGYQKVSIPYQNFLYIIETYDFLPSQLEYLAAILVPWGELFVGVFLALGLWLKVSLRLSQALFFSFIIIISQALIRSLPIDECGCFGEMLSIKPSMMIGLDMVTLSILFILFWKIKKSQFWSVDRYLLK